MTSVAEVADLRGGFVLDSVTEDVDGMRGNRGLR